MVGEIKDKEVLEREEGPAADFNGSLRRAALWPAARIEPRVCGKLTATGEDSESME